MARFLQLPVTAFVVAVACAISSAQESGSIPNGGFEEGAKGWMWEQWHGKPLPGDLDSEDSKEGKASFRMGMPGFDGGRYLAKEIRVEDASKDHVLRFWLKLSNVPERAARAALAVPGRGFFRGGDLVRSGGTYDWQEFKFMVPAADLTGASKVTLFVHHDRIGAGHLNLDGVSFAPGSLAAGEASVIPPPASAPAAKNATLTGDTSKPDTSTYVLGEKVELHFKVSDLKPGIASPKLLISIIDEHEKPVENRELSVQPDESGTWQTHIDAPAAHYGFYRVRASLSNGVPLQALGSRRPGFLTYAVVPDPGQREEFSEKETMFAMQGGFGPWGDQVLAYLGARWVLDGSLEWRKKEPDHAGQFNAEEAIEKERAKPVKPSAWKKFTYPTLFAAPKWAVIPETFSYMTGSLTPEGEKAWDDYCRKAAQVFMAKNPEREERIYQITWEPMRPWGFKGTDEALVRIHEIAYKALHDTDPKAVVAGPTQGLKELHTTLPLLKAGVSKYLDAFSLHPYFSINPERDGMVDAIRALKAAVADNSNKQLPFFGSEQGHSTEEDPQKELAHARGLIRQNLITLGEGYRINFAFYITDYRLAGQKGYGYYYNLMSTVPFGPDKISPRPIVPAYAAQSLLIEGHASVGPIEWLGETALGYAFERGENVVLALWDYGNEPSTVLIPVGSDKAVIYDWMGRKRAAAVTDGNLSIELGPEPVYIAGVSPELWGRRSRGGLVTLKDQPIGYPGAAASLETTLRASAGKPLHGTLIFSPDKRLAQSSITREVKLEAGKSEMIDVDINIPSEAKPGRYPVQVVLKDRTGASLAVSGCGLTVAPPISIVSVDPLDSTIGDQGVAVTLRNDRKSPTTGKVAFEFRYMNGTNKSTEFAIPAGATQRLLFRYPGSVGLPPPQVYQTQTTATTSDGYTLSHGTLMNFLTAQRITTKPAIDGDISDWAMPGFRLSGKQSVFGAQELYSGDEDLSATIRLGWNEEGLLASVEVTDDDFRPRGTNERADSMILAINLDPAKKEQKSGNLLADVAERPRSSELTFLSDKNGPQVIRSRTYDSDVLAGGAVSRNDIEVAVKRSGQQTVYELAIPWRTLGLRADEASPKAGDFVGIAMALADIDGNDEKQAVLGLYGAVPPAKSNIKFGTLVLGSTP